MENKFNIVDSIDYEKLHHSVIDRSFTALKDFNKIHYKQAKNSEKNYLVLHMRSPFGVDSIFDQIPNDVFLLMQQSIIRPLIFMTTEQWDLFDTYAWNNNKHKIIPDFGNVPYSKIIQRFTGRGIPEKNITWVVPDKNHIASINYLKNKGYCVDCQFIQFDYFLHLITQHTKNFTINPRTFSKHFSCLCAGNNKHHRYGMIYNLWQNNLFDKGLVSCNEYENMTETKSTNWVDDALTTDDFMNQFPTWKTQKKNFLKKLPLVYDGKENQHWDKKYDESQIFESSFLWISNETKKTHDGIYITEKTWKAIAYGSPFCINGDQNSLEYLHDHGFKTFETFWDESYDKQTNQSQRIKMITNIVRDICNRSLDEIGKLYQKMLPILLHNQKNLLYNNQYNNLIKTLSNDKRS